MAKKKTPPESIPQPAQDLIDRFTLHVDDYRAGKYNETQLRREFLDPLFKELGWDVDNEQGYAEAYKDVIHEDAIKIDGATKAPDYCFRIGGTRKFFLEAKKPSVNIKGDPASAFQLRRYAYSAKLPLSILSDFEEWAVYDCRIKPVKTDRASTARVLYFKYDQLPDRWDEFASIFSRDAVLKGSFDKYASSMKHKRGTTELDDDFLASIESWRELLARNIALRNTVTKRDLNFAVQRTLDRIIFLRICEDRGIEQRNALQALLNGDKVYERLFARFIRADEKYNSGLFHFQANDGDPTTLDVLTPALSIDDKTLKEILKQLYYPDSPYEFSVLPADILGQVYEQFLGKVITLTSGHRAKIEEKPEVRKAGGVYYTPTYIVDYIVKQTVGKLLEDRNLKTFKTRLPQMNEPLCVLDPACGSGSFLIGAYQFLIDWHLKWYLDNNPKTLAKSKLPPIRQTRRGDYTLTTAERKRILVEHIYGVDIDAQAVEVTKLSLLLKCLEGETEQTIQPILLAHERALPDLATNIKCGNSLIGSDFYDNQQMDMFDEEERLRINVFDWQHEFANIMESGGFDAVIGNPPYVKEYTYRVPFEQFRMARLRKYYQGKMDLWYAFACWSLDLLRTKGLHSFIATNNWITSSGASLLRQKILSETQLTEFVDFGDYKVFPKAGIQTMVYQIVKIGKPHSGVISYRRLQDKHASLREVKDFLYGRTIEVAQASFKATIPDGAPDRAINFINHSDAAVVDKIQLAGTETLYKKELTQGIVAPQSHVIKSHLKELHDSSIQTGDGIFLLSQSELKKLGLLRKEQEIIKPFYTTDELKRYYGLPRNARWVIYSRSDANEWIDNYPKIKKHLSRFTAVITSHNGPYGLHRAREETFFVGTKLISLRKTSRPHFTFVDFPCYVSQTFNIIKTSRFDLKYLCAILNSRLSHFWFDRRGKKQGELLQIDTGPLLAFPICPPPKKSNIQSSLLKHVQQMLDLHKKLISAKTPHEKTAINRQIKATDRQINQLVYKLYDLTDEEIAIVEEATA